MLVAIVFLAFGGYLLVRGADLLVDGSVGIALKHGISRMAVGLTIVAYGTSMPEFATSFFAAAHQSGDITFGNAVGSNVLNISLILGVAAILTPILVSMRLVRREILFMMAVTVLCAWVGYTRNVGRITGFFFLALFFGYIYLTVSRALRDKNNACCEKVDKSYTVLSLMTLLGVFMLGTGGGLFVTGAKDIARFLGVSEAVIALTVVGVGTSLPELFTSVIAAGKKQMDISLGNIVGSNIFNILLVLGTAGAVFPFRISDDAYLKLVGIPFMLGTAILLLPLARSNKRISRAEGVFLVFVTIVYFSLAAVLK